MFNALPPWYVWFDGVAGAALLAIGGFVFKRFWHKPEKTVEVHNAVLSGSITDSQVAAGSNITQTSMVHHHYGPDKPETELIVTRPDPLQILRSLDDLPPFDVELACEKFVGLPVLWRFTFGNVDTGGNRLYIVGDFRVRPLGRWANILFELSSVPSELKVAKSGTPIWVRGTIRKVAPPTAIVLENDPELLKVEHR